VHRLRPLLIIGTRPEGIKMAPVVHQCQAREEFDPIVCFTGQHREMLAQVSDYFNVQADIDLDLMLPNQTLAEITGRCIQAIDATIDRTEPDCVVAQGDTTTVMCASMAAFYRRLPFVHVEAGLRTYDLHSPWPEEFNRRVAGLTTTVHCAPTQRSADNLINEGVSPQNVHVTGNTVIDALMWTVERERNRSGHWCKKYPMLLENQRVVLITGHRRENFGEGFQSICRAILFLADRFRDVQFVYPVHLNPKVREPVYSLLGSQSNIHLVEPASYPEFVWLMDRSHLILTDSGGVQEEAPSLRKPVLVMRDTTERPEAVDAGAVQLVGTSEFRIIRSVIRLLSDANEYRLRQLDENPYGDGRAAQRIVDVMLSKLTKTELNSKIAV